MNRLDIKAADVFLSWTGEDAGLKDKIAAYFAGHGLIPLESQRECTGQYLKWSIEAAKSATVFLLLLTEHTRTSKNIPLEILSALQMEDAENRIIVVCERQALFRKLTFENFDPVRSREAGFPCDNFDPDELHRRKLSVIELGEGGLTQEKLEEIAHKTELLIINRAEHIFRMRQAPNFIRLASLSMRRGAVVEGDFHKLYRRRTVTELESGAECASAEVFFGKGVFFLHGPAGSGKTQYINQIRTEAPQNALILSLPCAKAAMSEHTLFEDMFQEFVRILGDRVFYTPENFRRLLSLRHTVLILDGMDEIATESGIRKFLQKVEEYYLPHSDGTTLLFTGRDEKDADMISFQGARAKKYRLNELTEEEIGALGEELFLLFGAGEKGKEFYVRIKDLNREIKANPLLLTQLAIIYREEGRVPETVVGIFDAISEITFRMDTQKPISEVPKAYEGMMRGLGNLLKQFSMERYALISEGKFQPPEKIFSKILTPYGYADKRERAQFLVEYLESRAILIDGEFYHKLFLEYFTAVGYYDRCYSDYDELERPEEVQKLFAHYREGYWAQVLQMFLIKADSLIGDDETEKLYSLILAMGITEYTLLLNTCQGLIRHKEEAQVVCVCDLLYKSAHNIYPPYGPLFWYVPEYGLYEAVLLAAGRLMGDAGALALARDVCYLYGRKYHCAEVTSKIDPSSLWEGACPKLRGVRRALIRQFLLGETEEGVGENVYPRCFNPAEVRALEERGYGIGGRMTEPFQDELGLYGHTSFNEFEGECYGLISCPYDGAFEEQLRPKLTRRVTGLAFTPAERTEFSEKLKFYCNSVRVLYFPENITEREGGMWGLTPVWAYKQLDCVISRDDIGYFWGNIADSNFWIEFNGMPFYRCDSLTEVSLPEGTEKICYGQFHRCRNLRRIYIPNSVKEIESFAFAYCSALEEVVIPRSVEQISDNAFESCENLYNIVICDGVQRIGWDAFSGCISLLNIRIPGSVREIDMGAFHDCKNLQSVQLESGLTEISISAFEGCSSLKEIQIPDSVTNINTGAFQNCNSLQEVRLSNNITELSGGLFLGCQNLQKITIPDRIRVINEGAFSDCRSLSKLVIPNGLKEIGENVFEDCISLRELVIPDSVKIIGSDAFKNCNGSIQIRLPKRFQGQEEFLGIPNSASIAWGNVMEKLPMTLRNNDVVGWYEFELRLDLTEFTVPEGVKKIESGAFWGCANLRRVELPDGLQSVETCAFERCLGLEEVSLPDGVLRLDTQAFKECSSLQKILLPDSVQEMGECAFAGCSRLHEMVIPNQVKEISKGLCMYCSSLEKVSIPESVKVIGGCAFQDCSSLQEINIPDGVTQIGFAAFQNCNSLQEIDIPSRVMELEGGTFAGCSTLKQVHIPQGVLLIGPDAFRGCSSLCEIDIPDSVTKIESAAFCDCQSLRKIVIPQGVKDLWDHVFYNCIELQNIVLPNSIATIERNAFQHCSSLKEITLPENLERIGSEAFEGCTALEEVVIPRGVYEIGDGAFKGCNGLKKVVLSANFKAELSRIFGDIDLKIIQFI